MFVHFSFKLYFVGERSLVWNYSLMFSLFLQTGWWVALSFWFEYFRFTTNATHISLLFIKFFWSAFLIFCTKIILYSCATSLLHLSKTIFLDHIFELQHFGTSHWYGPSLFSCPLFIYFWYVLSSFTTSIVTLLLHVCPLRLLTTKTLRLRWPVPVLRDWFSSSDSDCALLYYRNTSSALRDRFPTCILLLSFNIIFTSIIIRWSQMKMSPIQWLF